MEVYEVLIKSIRNDSENEKRIKKVEESLEDLKVIFKDLVEHLRK